MSNRVIQCRECGRLFQSYGPGVCPLCVEEMDEQFNKVKNYLYDHPDSNVIDIAEATEVPEKTVLYFIKEGRISVNESANILECERCGEPISAGRFCKTCHSMLKEAFDSVCPQPTKEASVKDKNAALGKMHFDYMSK